MILLDAIILILIVARLLITANQKANDRENDHHQDRH